jgi:hypothetical protein
MRGEAFGVACEEKSGNKRERREERERMREYDVALCSDVTIEVIN